MRRSRGAWLRLKDTAAKHWPVLEMKNVGRDGMRQQSKRPLKSAERVIQLVSRQYQV